MSDRGDMDKRVGKKGRLICLSQRGETIPKGWPGKPIIVLHHDRSLGVGFLHQEIAVGLDHSG